MSENANFINEPGNDRFNTALCNLRMKKALLSHIEVDARKAAIETNEPLVLVTTHPSNGRFSIMLRRIDYMTASDVPYDSICIISPTSTDVEDISAMHRFTGNTTVSDMAKRIAGKYPIRYKHFIINDVHDIDADAIVTIMQFASENNISLFILGDTNQSELMKSMVESDTFIVYNL